MPKGACAIAVAVGAACLLTTIGATADGKPIKLAVTCPLAAGTPTGGQVQWAFSVTKIPPNSPAAVTNVYTHGHGNWAQGRGAGTICEQYYGTDRDVVVLAVSGKSQLSPHITRMGLLGVGLRLGLTVSASDDQTCPTGTAGTMTFFASYYSVHRDTAELHFATACAAHDVTFSGGSLRLMIGASGRQVNSVP